MRRCEGVGISGNRSWDVGSGDVVYLTPGTTSTWVVHTPMREFFVAFTAGHQTG